MYEPDVIPKWHTSLSLSKAPNEHNRLHMETRPLRDSPGRGVRRPEAHVAGFSLAKKYVCGMTSTRPWPRELVLGARRNQPRRPPAGTWSPSSGEEPVTAPVARWHRRGPEQAVGHVFVESRGPAPWGSPRRPGHASSRLHRQPEGLRVRTGPPRPARWPRGPRQAGHAGDAKRAEGRRRSPEQLPGHTEGSTPRPRHPGIALRSTCKSRGRPAQRRTLASSSRTLARLSRPLHLPCLATALSRDSTWCFHLLQDCSAAEMPSQQELIWPVEVREGMWQREFLQRETKIHPPPRQI